MGISSASFPTPPSNTRLGLHYFPDTLHYREVDLQTWLPELKELGVSWLVLRSDLGRAVPEHFLRGLKAAGIEPVIQFSLSLERLTDPKEINMLLDVYARWGARYVIFFDRPNSRSSWPVTGWVQQDLVERFLDRYLPVASLALQYGLIPVFPPLEPGGSYWDTAFLRSALEALQRRRQETLLQKLVLSAYAWTGGHSLNWGVGGPEQWPEAHPYPTPPSSQDQRGFRIFDWYLSIARSVLHQDCPMILLNAGLPGDPLDGQVGISAPALEDTISCVSIAHLLRGETRKDPLEPGRELEPMANQVIACSFWLLSADPGCPAFAHAWLEGKGRRRPIAEAIRAWQRERVEREAKACLEKTDYTRAISHYLLLPGSEWGVSDWYLEVIRPFVKKYRPTVGFSLEEAERAARVTIIGNSQNYPEDLLSRLQKASCWIEQIGGDGTKIATELAEK